MCVCTCERRRHKQTDHLIDLKTDRDRDEKKDRLTDRKGGTEEEENKQKVTKNVAFFPLFLSQCSVPPLISHVQSGLSAAP